MEMTNELADMDDVMLEALAELGRAINEDEPENLESAKVASPGCTCTLRGRVTEFASGKPGEDERVADEEVRML